MEKATFAMGCFWSPDKLFSETQGVKNVIVGYTICKKDGKVTYEQVCSGETGCAESVTMEFDPKIISYDKLLDVFFANHNPTTSDRQGPDVGSQYRSAIMYHSEEQKKKAIASMERWQKNFNSPIVTEIVSASEFHKAEEYHQKYYMKKT
ncbi:peptide-methionine (S)-S-oxide reductase MsrA [Candidatus Woesearchaeota archaeon]|nr:peptide-methionine (S)-S-oxide reductase MsrA [Candidatus Woesearchaeota archaeon]